MFAENNERVKPFKHHEKEHPETDPISLSEERNYCKKNHISRAQENLKQSAEVMIRNSTNNIKNKHMSNIENDDLVYVMRNFWKMELSPLYYDHSIVIEKKYPIFLIESIGSKKQRWMHHNQIKKKPSIETFLTKKHPNKGRANNEIGHKDLPFETTMNNFEDTYDYDDNPIDNVENNIILPLSGNKITQEGEDTGSTLINPSGQENEQIINHDIRNDTNNSMQMQMG